MVIIKGKFYFTLILLLIIIFLPANTAYSANYTVQCGYFSKVENANSLYKKLKNNNFDVYKYEKNDHFYIIVGNFNTINKSKEVLKDVKKYIPSAYVKEINNSLLEYFKKIKQIEIKNNENKKNIDEELNEVKVLEEKSDNHSNIINHKIEATNDKKNIDYYLDNHNYRISIAYFNKYKNDSYEFILPNGNKKNVEKINKELNLDESYYLISKKDQLVDIIKRNKNNLVTYSLKDLGVKEDILLKGFKPSYQLTITPIDNINTKEAVIYLNVECSNVIESNSYIEILVNNKSLKKIQVKENKDQYVIRVNKTYYENNKNIDLEIKPYLINNKTAGSTIEYYEKSWVKIINDSKIEFNLENKLKYNISNFISSMAKEINLFYSRKSDKSTLENYIKIYHFLNKTLNNYPVDINLMGVIDNNQLNNIDNLIHNIIISGEHKSTFIDDSNTLKITNKDVDFFLSDLYQSINSNQFNVINFNNLSKTNNKKIFNLKEMNKKGWGIINYSYYFPVNIFSKWPKELKLSLTGSQFIPVDGKADRRIYLNNKLIRTDNNLTSTYFVDDIINIPGSELEYQNELKILYRHNLNKNINKYSNKMEIYLSPKSYITYDNGVINKNNLSNTATNFNGRGLLLIEKESLNTMINSAAKLIGLLETDSNNITLEFIENYQEKNDDDIDWYLIFANKKNNIKSPIIKKTEQLNITEENPEDVIKFNTNSKYSFLELNNLNNKPLIYVHGDNNIIVNEMISKINKDDLVENIDKNVFIYNQNNLYKFNIKITNDMDYINNYFLKITNQFDKYKNHIYIFTVILVVVLFYIIYKKSVKLRREDKTGQVDVD